MNSNPHNIIPQKGFVLKWTQRESSNKYTIIRVTDTRWLINDKDFLIHGDVLDSTIVMDDNTGWTWFMRSNGMGYWTQLKVINKYDALKEMLNNE